MMHQPEDPSLALDQSRIMRFALIGALIAIAVMSLAWVGLSRSDLDAIGADPAACCPDHAAGAVAESAASSETVATGPAWLLDTTGFPRRWNCGTWSAELGWIHVLGDLSIWGAYMAIPVVLGIFVLRGGSPLPTPIWLFIAFIGTCGIGHLVESVIFYEPIYRFSGVWKWVIAIISWATVASLLPTVPQVLRWPRLADLNQDLMHLNRSLELQQQQLHITNERLKNTNDELEQFVYGASHDLKSPLVTISGFLTHLERDLQQGRTDALPGHIDRIARSTARMKSCVDDLLEVSRVGHITAEVEDVDLADVVRRLEIQIHDRLDADGIRLDSDLQTSTLLATPSHIDRALHNLVENAMLHGRAPDGTDSVITVGSRRLDGETRLFVRDNGPGVPADHQQRIFELFQRLSTDGQGTGVGLTVVQRVAAARHGRAWVESPPDGGATFWMSFPDPIDDAWDDDA